MVWSFNNRISCVQGLTPLLREVQKDDTVMSTACNASMRTHNLLAWSPAWGMAAQRPDTVLQAHLVGEVGSHEKERQVHGGPFHEHLNEIMHQVSVSRAACMTLHGAK